jgi:fucose permease
MGWVLFIFAEWRFAKYAIMPLRLFRDWHNILLFLVCFCQAFVFIAGAFFLPPYFQTVLLATPILSGVYTLPQVLSLSITSAVVGRLIRKTGFYKEVIVLGMGLMALGFGLFIDLKSYTSWPQIIIFQLIAGTGVGPNFLSPLVALQANVHASNMAVITATYSFVRQLAASTSVVLGTVVYQNTFAKQIPQLISIVGPETAFRLASSFSGSNKNLLER